MEAPARLRIVHLSDLHAGRHSLALAPPLLHAVRSVAPDLVLISGDLTNRLREHEVGAARELLARLAVPWRSVPGNHDLPLDPALRLLSPWRRFRPLAGAGALPAGLALGLIRTALPLAVSRGKIHRFAAAGLAAALDAQAGGVRIVVGHHPPRVAADGIAHALALAGADLYLCGHDHRFRLDRAGRTLIVAAPAALAGSAPGADAGFLVLDLGARSLRLTRHERAGARFRPAAGYELRGPSRS